MKHGARYVIRQYWYAIGRTWGPRRLAVRYFAYTIAEAIDVATRRQYPASWIERRDQPATRPRPA
jgi:hypothetical protein